MRSSRFLSKVLTPLQSAGQEVAARLSSMIPSRQEPDVEYMVSVLQNIGYERFSGSGIGGALTSFKTPDGKYYCWDGYPQATYLGVSSLFGGGYAAVVRRHFRKEFGNPRPAAKAGIGEHPSP